jgi:hypothetical protein
VQTDHRAPRTATEIENALLLPRPVGRQRLTEKRDVGRRDLQVIRFSATDARTELRRGEGIKAFHGRQCTRSVQPIGIVLPLLDDDVGSGLRVLDDDALRRRRRGGPEPKAM